MVSPRSSSLGAPRRTSNPQAALLTRYQPSMFAVLRAAIELIVERYSAVAPISLVPHFKIYRSKTPERGIIIDLECSTGCIDSVESRFERTKARIRDLLRLRVPVRIESVIAPAVCTGTNADAAVPTAGLEIDQLLGLHLQRA